MNGAVPVVMPAESRTMNAMEYVACLEDVLLGNDQIDSELRKAIRHATVTMRDLKDALLMSIEPRWAEAIRDIPIISYPTSCPEAILGKPPSRKGILIFWDPWLGNAIYSITAARFSGIGTPGLLMGYALSSYDEIRIGRVFEAFLRPEHDQAAKAVRGTGVLFILAHELAHAICGHLADQDAFGGDFPVLEDIEVYQRSRTRELQADTIAFQMLLQAHRGTGKVDQNWVLLLHTEIVFWIFNAIEIVRRSYYHRLALADFGYDSGIRRLIDSHRTNSFSDELESRVTAESLKPALEKARKYMDKLDRESTHPTSTERVKNLQDQARQLLGSYPDEYRRNSEQMRALWTDPKFIDSCEGLGSAWFDRYNPIDPDTSTKP